MVTSRGRSVRRLLQILLLVPIASTPAAAQYFGLSGTATPPIDTANPVLVLDGVSQSILGDPSQYAALVVSYQAAGPATLNIKNGGGLRIDGTGGPGPYDFLSIGSGGGNGTVTVNGRGSSLTVAGNNPIIQDGRSGAGGQGSFSVLAGASASALLFIVGRDSSSGQLTIDGKALDGTSSTLTLQGVGNNSACSGCAAIGFIGENGGQGTVNVSNGGTWLISGVGVDTRASGGGPSLLMGYQGGGATGQLTITGPGSTVSLVSSSLGLGSGVGDNYNPLLSVGNTPDTTASLTISGGGQLLLAGNAVSTQSNARVTALKIGGQSATTGTQGSVTVTGAGSQIVLSGYSDFVGVGVGPGSVGALTVADHGRVASTSLVAGDRGGSGMISIDGGTIALSGYRADLANQGAGVTIGRGSGGLGSLSLSNGGALTIQNDTYVSGMSIGGDRYDAGGTGNVSLSGGSSIQILGPVSGAGISVGYTGVGTLSLAGASHIDAGPGGSIYVGRISGASGQLSLSGGSTVVASYVGIGSTPGVDTGVGTLTIDNSTVTASTVEVGSAGLLKGVGPSSLIVGQVINRGTINPDPPGQPGTLAIDGGLQNATGGRLLLDILADGHGGFTASQLVFIAGSNYGFDNMQVSFDFLGSTDPTAFLKSGQFVLDSFLRSRSTSGIDSGLSTGFGAGVSYASLFASAQFSATADAYEISNFVFTPDGTASFTAAPVPEPAPAPLLLGGLAFLAVCVRRRHRQAVRGSWSNPGAKLHSSN